MLVSVRIDESEAEDGEGEAGASDSDMDEIMGVLIVDIDLSDIKLVALARAAFGIFNFL